MIHLTQERKISYSLSEIPPIGQKRKWHLRAADFGSKMTICIAAKSREGCLVAVTDRLLSFEDYPAQPGLEDTIIKANMVDDRWYALLAGNIPPALSIIGGVQQLATHDVPPSLKEMEHRFKQVYSAHFREAITDEVLSKFDLEWATFKQLAGKGEYSDIRKAIRDYSVAAFFLVFGIDENDHPQIFEVLNPGRVVNHGEYWAIGIGADAALTHISARPIAYLTLQNLVYRLCEIKFATEMVQGVGCDTTLFVVSKSLGSQLIRSSYIAELRKVWERERIKLAPDDAIEIIQQALRSQS